MPSLPPHITWPAFIIALFCAGTFSTISMLWIAKSDGGAQVVEDYYARAVAWDETAERRAASDALGWSTSVEVGGLDGADLMRPVTFVVHDSLGAPVDGLTGVVRASRPQLAGAQADGAFDPVDGRPGMYHVRLPMHAYGLWDLDVEARLDSALFLSRIRKELTP